MAQSVRVVVNAADRERLAEIVADRNRPRSSAKKLNPKRCARCPLEYT
jgi:CRISPR/Cas system-associated exonuclease Cas4 (RecB family)